MRSVHVLLETDNQNKIYKVCYIITQCSESVLINMILDIY